MTVQILQNTKRSVCFLKQYFKVIYVETFSENNSLQASKFEILS